MATILNRQVTFATNGTVTAAGLHNLIDETEIYAGIITTQPVITSVGSSDQLLIADSDLTATSAPRRVTVGSMFNDALNNGIYTNSSFTGTLTAGSFVGPLNGNVTGTIIGTGGTISSLTTGTTTSTSANITNGTVQTLTASTANITTGTVATLNSTTGTITNLSATTSTFLGAITASTNTIAIGSVQFCKDANGNVGIGESVPSSKFEVRSGGGSNAGAKATYEGAIKINETGLTTLQSTGGIEFKGSVFGSGYGSKILGADDGQLLIGNRQNSASWTERMRIDGSGNVNIGSESVNTLRYLDVTNGNTGANAGADLRLITSNVAGSGNVAVDIVKYKNGRFTISNTETNAAAFTSFDVGASERLRIDSSGNVGIGATTLANKLEIVGSFGRGAPVTKTVDFTLADTENWIIVNKGSAGTATLPAASSWTGREFTIKVITAHTVVSASSNVVPRNSTTAGTAILAAAAGNWATLVSNGTNWVAMCGS
jgi:hypothetical protein